MIRVAAVGDLHIDGSNARAWRTALEPCSDDADVLLLAGDLTELGTPAEAHRLARALQPIRIPIVAVLGNHDCQSNQEGDVSDVLKQHGVHVLEGHGMLIEGVSPTLGVAGVKGFGGGFRGACGTDFGEPQMKEFVRTTARAADGLRRALCELSERSALRIALLHYAPIPATLRGERREIYPFLGSSLLEDAIDASGADLVLHGHAHRGFERGRTAAGAPVRNVARPVIGEPYRVYAVPGARRCPTGSRRRGAHARRGGSR